MVKILTMRKELRVRVKWILGSLQDYLKRDGRYWHLETPVGGHIQAGQLGGYYLDFSRRANYPGPYDSRGIPQIDYGPGVGLQYNPIMLCQYSLANHEVFLTTEEEKRKRAFLSIADWLVAHQKLCHEHAGAWEFLFDHPFYPLRAPWISAMAQGEGISVLVRAWQLQRDNTYLVAAERALGPFRMSITAGGVQAVRAGEYIFFEEIPVEPPPHILNGFVFALWGIYDLNLVTQNPEARMLFTEGLRTLERFLDHYDLGFWTSYQLEGGRLANICSPAYHLLHIHQLEALHRITGRDVFLAWAEKWKAYQNNFSYRMAALFLKSLFKVVSLVSAPE